MRRETWAENGCWMDKCGAGVGTPHYLPATAPLYLQQADSGHGEAHGAGPTTMTFSKADDRESANRSLNSSRTVMTFFWASIRHCFIELWAWLSWTSLLSALQTARMETFVQPNKWPSQLWYRIPYLRDDQRGLRGTGQPLRCYPASRGQYIRYL
jgi:hypothetical protein